MKKTIFLCLLTVALLLSSCGYLEGKGLLPAESETEPEHLEDNELELVKEMIHSNAIGRGEPFSNLPLGDKHEGTLTLTVNDAKVVHNFRQNGLSTENIYGSPSIELNGSIYKYPDYLDENSELIEGCSLLLVDVTIENIDAIRNKFADFPDANDPDLFRGDGFLCLVNLNLSEGGTTEEGQFVYKSVNYFSLLNSEPVHPMAFRLEQGKTIQVQIGFFLDDAWDDLDALFLSNTAGQYSSSDDHCLFIDLNLLDGESGT